MQAQVLQVSHGEWVMMSDSGWSTLSDVRKCLLNLFRKVSSSELGKAPKIYQTNMLVWSPTEL